jgi:uncharacterized tellurite resistance protein B-like protein
MTTGKEFLKNNFGIDADEMEDVAFKMPETPNTSPNVELLMSRMKGGHDMELFEMLHSDAHWTQECLELHMQVVKDEDYNLQELYYRVVNLQNNQTGALLNLLQQKANEASKLQDMCFQLTEMSKDGALGLSEAIAFGREAIKEIERLDAEIAKLELANQFSGFKF